MKPTGVKSNFGVKFLKFTFDTFSFGASRRSCLLNFWQRLIQVLQKPTNLSFIAKALN